MWSLIVFAILLSPVQKCVKHGEFIPCSWLSVTSLSPEKIDDDANYYDGPNWVSEPRAFGCADDHTACEVHRCEVQVSKDGYQYWTLDETYWYPTLSSCVASVSPYVRCISGCKERFVPPPKTDQFDRIGKETSFWHEPPSAKVNIEVSRPEPKLVRNKGYEKLGPECGADEYGKSSLGCVITPKHWVCPKGWKVEESKTGEDTSVAWCMEPIAECAGFDCAGLGTTNQHDLLPHWQNWIHDGYNSNDKIK
jgi:hypothetical protein